MIIHNFFSDTAQSIFNFFEKFVFPTKPYFYYKVVNDQDAPKTFFKSMQFNLGNRVYQIGDYKKSAKLEFPTAILSYVSDDSAFGRDMPLIAHHPLCTVNEIIATHNEDTDVDIIVREDQTIMYFTFQINCESQLQANEIVHQIKRYLPTQKYIQMYNFRSFVEIPEYFFFEKNDPKKHSIKNLFFREDQTTGTPQYYFLAKYKPIFKLNAITADFSENSQRSYTVLLDFEYLIQLPVWMTTTYNTTEIFKVDVGFMIDDNPMSIITNDNQLSDDNYPKKINDIYYKLFESRIVTEDDASNKDNKIIIEKPDISDKFILELIKLKPSFSDIVDNEEYNSKIKNSESKILVDNDYKIEKTQDGNNDQIIIFTDDQFKPENNSPIIIRVLLPLSDKDFIIEDKKNNFYKKNKLFIIKDQKPWRM